MPPEADNGRGPYGERLITNTPTDGVIYFKFVSPERNTAEHWPFGVSPEGLGTIGMVINFAIATVVALLTPPPPREIRELVDDIRMPDHAPRAHQIEA